MKNKIVQFIRSADNLKETIKESVFLARALKKRLELSLILETRYEFGYHMAFPLTTGLTSMEYAGQQETFKSEAKEKLEDFLKRNSELVEGVEVTYDVLTGITEDILWEKSKDEDSFMLIISEKEDQPKDFISGVFHTLSGSPGCPVMLIPAHYDPVPLKNILYATDYNEEDFKTLNKLAEIVAPFNSQITALHIADKLDMDEKLKSKGFETMAREKVSYQEISFTVYPYSDIEEGILEYSLRTKADLIVVLKENKGFIDNLIHGSYSKRILKKSELPVLVCGC
jgi:nucleotide-binding universal stress UspA family protein